MKGLQPGLFEARRAHGFTCYDIFVFAANGETVLIAEAVFNALKHFLPANQTGIVIGSGMPWVEAMLLFHKATKVITSEYATLRIQHKNLQCVNPLALSVEWKN